MSQARLLLGVGLRPRAAYVEFPDRVKSTGSIPRNKSSSAMLDVAMVACLERTARVVSVALNRREDMLGLGTMSGDKACTYIHRQPELGLGGLVSSYFHQY